MIVVIKKLKNNFIIRNMFKFLYKISNQIIYEKNNLIFTIDIELMIIELKNKKINFN